MSNSNIFNIILTILLIVVIVVCFVIWIPKRAENARLEQELVKVRQELKRLQDELENINQDAARLKKGEPYAIEKVARDKYGYSREGEEIYQAGEAQ